MTQKEGFSKLCVKIKKKMLNRPTPFFNTHTVSITFFNLFSAESYFDSRIALYFFIYSFFFQEKTLGDISFKLETKIMNFMSGFFHKKI
jgi:hypothetical protein